MLAASEGERNITGNFQNDTTDCWTISSTTTCENAIWTWGNQFSASNYCTSNPSLTGLWCASPIAGVQLGVPSAIHFWVPESYPGGCNYPVVGWNNPTTPVGCTEHFMVHYVVYALGRAKDLGFAANPLLAWIGSYLINDVVSGPNPFLASSYGTVTVQSTGQYFTTYTDIQAQMCSSSTVGPCVTLGTSDDAQTWNGFEAPINRYSCSLEAAGDGNCSGAYQLGLALSQVADQTNGASAWSWVNTNAMTNTALNIDPKWAVMPRSLACSITPTSVGPYTNGQIVSQTFTATGCNSSTWAASGLSGSGLSINSSTGVLSGTAATGAYSATFTYDTGSQPMTITVNASGSTVPGAIFSGATIAH
jgi:hypothetical protein